MTRDTIPAPDTTDDDAEYARGRRDAMLTIARAAVFDDAPEAGTPHEIMARLVRLESERAAAVAMARELCEEHELPNDWPDTVHLADIIEKRLYRPLVGG